MEEGEEEEGEDEHLFSNAAAAMLNLLGLTLTLAATKG